MDLGTEFNNDRGFPGRTSAIFIADQVMEKGFVSKSCLYASASRKCWLERVAHLIPSGRKGEFLWRA